MWYIHWRLKSVNIGESVVTFVSKDEGKKQTGKNGVSVNFFIKVVREIGNNPIETITDKEITKTGD
jgi:hypothetical protein